MERIKKALPSKSKRSLIIIILLIFTFLCLCSSAVAVGAFIYLTNKSNSPDFSNEEDYYGFQWQEDTTSCTLPVIEFKESAFSIGVPEGWIYEIDNGTIAIMEDETNLNAAFLYTAKLEKDLTAGQFLTEFADVFNTIITNAGGSFSISEVDEQNNIATTTAAATVEEGDLTGKFLVEKDSEFVTLKVYWAPVNEFNKSEALLQQVVDCFQRTTLLTDEILAAAETWDEADPYQSSGNFQPYTGTYFKLMLPENFQVTGETDSGIDISRFDDQAGFSYAYLTGAQGPYTPRSWVQMALPDYMGISNLELGDGVGIPSEISGYTIEEFTFSGYLNGNTAVTGKTTAGVYNTPNYGFGQSSSAFWAVQIATPQVWPSVANDLQTLQNSVEITDIGSRANIILPPNRPIETTGGSSITSGYEYRNSVSDKAHQNWSDAMRGYESAKSPSTGETYDAPINSWNSTGPDGGGYYRSLPGGGVEKLEPVE